MGGRVYLSLSYTLEIQFHSDGKYGICLAKKLIQIQFFFVGLLSCFIQTSILSVANQSIFGQVEGKHDEACIAMLNNFYADGAVCFIAIIFITIIIIIIIIIVIILIIVIIIRLISGL